jgi:hypothetical protein
VKSPYFAAPFACFQHIRAKGNFCFYGGILAFNGHFKRLNKLFALHIVAMATNLPAWKKKTLIVTSAF